MVSEEIIFFHEDSEQDKVKAELDRILAILNGDKDD